MTALGIIGLILGIIVMIVFSLLGIKCRSIKLAGWRSYLYFQRYQSLDRASPQVGPEALQLYFQLTTFYSLFLHVLRISWVKPVPAPRLPINSSTGSERSISSLFYLCSASFSATAASAFSYACLQLDDYVSNLFE